MTTVDADNGIHQTVRSFSPDVALVGWLGLRVGGHQALNWVNCHSGLAMMTAP